MLKTIKDKFNKLGQAFSLDRLSDKHLKLVRKASQVSATLAAGHAGIWVAVGLAGAVALGLNALGVGIPMFLGVGTIALGGIFALKSAVVNRASDALYKASTHLLEKRGIVVKKTPANAPAPKEEESKVATTPPLKPAFAPVAQNAPEAPKPPAPPAPPPPKPEAPKP